jgi:hypothetical protein
MTPAETQAIDDARREREDELLLLLLLMLGWAVEQPGASVDTAAGVLNRYGVDEIARTMADAHLDGFAFYSPSGRRPNAEELARQYEPAAGDMVDAIVATMRQTPGADLAAILLAARYSRSDSTGLRLGAERQVTTAGNAGLLDGAIALYGPITALRHRSVVDDRTTVICRQRDGLTLRADDPYWLTNWPSLHFNCRSIIEILDEPVTMSSTYPTRLPDDGFGLAPLIVRSILRRAARDAA